MVEEMELVVNEVVTEMVAEIGVAGLVSISDHGPLFLLYELTWFYTKKP